ncbi:acryloyl-CoA reductase [Paenibacillus hamazuiensis]|uniref:acrylyl-CoA reductase family protein n=1 Tax=Paenibacillus hamazuiensis TaxID=2936508 RepID=UPI00200D4C62|nr:acryloyl-CoA reductase [Paenibacillus hamazuiensis]
MEPFRVFWVDKTEEAFTAGVRTVAPDALPDGEVTIRVVYSGVNYKDGLAASPSGRVLRAYPMVPGVDLAGVVTASDDPKFREGDEVIVTGYELGVAHFGGFSEYARVPAAWVQPLPPGLTLREAMILGTSGFTAALSIQRLEANGLSPSNGPVLVTGATGGVGSSAVSMLASLGYEVEASTGKADEHAYLKALGASSVIGRDQLSPAEIKPLHKERWAAAVDPVGGPALPFVLGGIRYGGSVALSGLTGGANFAATVYPFILRGVNLLGIDSVYCPNPLRGVLWKRLASDLKPNRLEEMVYAETTLDGLPAYLERILQGGIRGRVLVKLG